MQLKEKIEQAEAVFFDLFHTLFSVVRDRKAIKTCHVLGIPEENWTRMLFESSDERLRGLDNDKYSIIRKLAHKYNPNITEEVIRQAADFRHARFHKSLSEVDSPNIEVLQNLKNRGKKIGLISNADSVEISGWPASQFAPIFDSVVFSYQIGHVKPEPEIYQYALDSLGIAVKDALFVGDGSCNELRGAKEIGLTTVMTTEITQHLWPEKIPAIRVNADYVIDKFDQLV